MSKHRTSAGPFGQQLLLAGLGLLVLAGGGYAVWHFVLRDDEEKQDSPKANHAAAKDNTQKPTSKPEPAISTGKELIDPDEANPLDPTFYSQAEAWAGYFHNKPIRKLTEDSAKEVAQRIKNAWGGWLPDDEDAIYKAFSDLNSKADVSLVANAYESLLGVTVTLEQDLHKRLSADEFKKVQGIIQTKKNYIVI